MPGKVRPAKWMLVLLLLALLVVPAVPAHAQQPPTTEELFAHYYWHHHGTQTLGNIQSPMLKEDGIWMQYYEKGRLEDHRPQNDNPAEQVGYTPLTHHLMSHAPDLPIDGLPVTYGMLRDQYSGKHPQPEGFGGGTLFLPGGVFVPADYGLAPADGYLVPYQFWVYINRRSLFPGGWMHAIGLPITHAFDVLVPTATGEKRLVVQAFDRTVLVLDMSETHDWSVRRANIGTDAVWMAGMQPQHTPHPPAPPDLLPDAPRRIEVDIGQQWLWAYQGDVLVLDAPISSGKDGFNTPRGEWRIYARYRQKTLRGSGNGESWNVPDVPAVLFYYRGVAIHGVYWHDRFGTGERHSHGCVGLAPHDAISLFDWAPLGTLVRVR